MKKTGMYVWIWIVCFMASGFVSPLERDVLSLIKPSPVIATINCEAVLYRDHDETAGRTGVIHAGTKIEILQDRSAKWYRVREVDDDASVSVWIKREVLDIPPDTEPNPDRMTVHELEEYARLVRFESETDYYVLTDIDRQLIHVYHRNGPGAPWKLAKTMVCSTGKNESPTTRGRFVIGERGEWFYSERLGSGSMYWVRFNGSYLFHSVAMDKYRNIMDEVIGDRRSMGCVRLMLDDAKWFYENVPDHSGVYIT